MNIPTDRTAWLQADHNAWIEQVILSGDEVCEQAFESEDEHYRVMEEEADQEVGLVIVGLGI